MINQFFFTFQKYFFFIFKNKKLFIFLSFYLTVFFTLNIYVSKYCTYKNIQDQFTQRHILYISVYLGSCFTICIVLPLNKFQFEDERRLTGVRVQPFKSLIFSFLLYLLVNLYVIIFIVSTSTLRSAKEKQSYINITYILHLIDFIPQYFPISIYEFLFFFVNFYFHFIFIMLCLHYDSTIR